MDLLSPLMTDSGWIYSVGALHDHQNRLFGRPMYYPDENGDRVFQGKRYKKYQRRADFDLLPSQPYAACVQIDPWSVLVPVDRIAEVVDTRRAFARWLDGPDPRVSIIEQLLTTAGIKTGQCGLGGSAGVGCETPASDVDILLYGSASTLACRRAIEDAILNGEIGLMTQEVAAAYAERYSRLYNIDQNHLHAIFAGDPTKVYYRGQKISFIFAYSENERDKIPARLYTESVLQTPEICLRARVIDGSASWVYPRKYIIEQQSGELHQVWSHHWLRDPVTPAGTLVEVVGRDLGDGVVSLTGLGHRIIPLTS